MRSNGNSSDRAGLIPPLPHAASRHKLVKIFEQSVAFMHTFLHVSTVTELTL